MALPRFWLISVPDQQGAFQQLKSAVDGQAKPYELNIPSLRCGTLDDLMSLSDELEKTELIVEKICKRIGSTLFRLTEETQRNVSLKQVLMVGNTSAEDFVTEFSWDVVKYPYLKQNCKDIAATIVKDCGELEETFKKQMGEFGEVEQEIQQQKKKDLGNLMIKDLSGIVKPQDVVQSEYLVTLLVVVPKHSLKDWFNEYETLMPIPEPPQPPPIVPRSSVQLAVDEEYCLMTVVILRLVESEFKIAARQRRFIVRDFVPAKVGDDPQTTLRNLNRKRDEMRSDLLVWCRATYTDIFSGWIHLKIIRLFIEAVLRYGLPAKFCNSLLLVSPKKRKGPPLCFGSFVQIAGFQNVEGR
jgi:V-type H+-transporting ATPase subunit C